MFVHNRTGGWGRMVARGFLLGMRYIQTDVPLEYRYAIDIPLISIQNRTKI
jgi:hypothetical protein